MTENNEAAEAAEELPEEEKAEEKKEEKREPIEVAITDIELENLQQEAGEFKEKYFRVLAEQENTRKRLMKEKEKLSQYAKESLIVDFIHPIDQMENALKFTQQVGEEVKHWAMGFEMILNEFKRVLAENGIKTKECVGQHYDPHLHEVVETVETDEHPPGTILKETLKGYYCGDRALRAAHVAVAKEPKSEKVNNKE